MDRNISAFINKAKKNSLTAEEKRTMRKNLLNYFKEFVKRSKATAK